MLEHKDYTYKFDEVLCSSCEGNCCIGESGYIWISNEEIATLSNYLGISTEDTILRYLIKVNYKYSIKERKISENNFSCIFFDLNKKQCSVYEARPIQCRTFPFWEYFKNNIDELVEECPAIIK